MPHLHINFIDQNQIPPPEEKKPRQTRRFIFIILAVSLIILAGGCLTKALIGKYTPTNPADYDAVTLKPKAPEGFLNKLKYYIFNQGNNLQGQSDDRINILLLGIGGAGHDGPELTDTIILLSLKPSTGKVAMISIPRDLAADIPGHGIVKINNANAYGEIKNPGFGPELSKEIIEKIFDIKIPYYVRVDFKAFEEIVDALGGVKVNVEKSFTDPMYPTNDYEYQTVSFVQGVKDMNGNEALKYARSRHGNNGEGSDFARSKRQQQILLAIKEKIFSFGTLANPFRISNIINSLTTHINTNLDFSYIMELARLSKNLDTKNIINVVFDDGPLNYLKSTFGADGAYLLVPKDGNFDKINKLIKNVFEQGTVVYNNTPQQEVPTSSLPEAKIEIINGTWQAGLAARMKQRLEEKNLLVSTIGNAEDRPQTISGIYKISNNNFQDTTSALEKELHISVKTSLPANIQAASTTDILILLGEDLQE